MMRHPEKIITAGELMARQAGKGLVLVASRRTDYPGCYARELLAVLNQGWADCQPPRNPPTRLLFAPEQIGAVSLWSQDFTSWLMVRDGLVRPYDFVYRYTLLPDSPLSGTVGALSARLDHLAVLAGQADPRTIEIYIDPIIKYRVSGSAGWRLNVDEAQVTAILRRAREVGTDGVTISFLDLAPYRNRISGRLKRMNPRLELYDWNPEVPEDLAEMRTVASMIGTVAARYGYPLKTCAEKLLVVSGGVVKGACIDGRRLNGLFGGQVAVAAATGMRRVLGCGCTTSYDIGSYALRCAMGHPYCYAHPVCD